MTTFVNIKKSCALFMILATSFGFVSCDNDDVPTPPTEATVEAMYGDYSGKMLSASVNPTEKESEGTPVGTDVFAKADKDTIYFEAFPIRDIVVSVVGEEMADQIVKAVGDVNYKIGYEPKLNEAKDSISYALVPKPLTLAVTIPSANEEKPQVLNIEVKVSAGENGNYELETTNLKFKFNAEEVSLVNGEVKTPIQNFKPTTFDFNMKKASK